MEESSFNILHNIKVGVRRPDTTSNTIVNLGIDIYVVDKDYLCEQFMF